MLDHKKAKYFFFNFLPVYFIYLALQGIVFEKGTWIAFVVGSFFLLTSFGIIKNYSVIPKYFKMLLINVFYFLILVFFSSNIILSFKIFNQVLLTWCFLILGYTFINNLYDFKKMNKKMIILLHLFILNLIIVNIFNLGQDSYWSADYDAIMKIGNIFTQGLNSVSYALILVPYIIQETLPKKKLYILIVASISFILQLLYFKRISIFATLFGFVVLFIHNQKKKKLVLFFIGFVLLLLAFYPLYKEKLLTAYAIREHRMKAENFSEEGRFRETFIILEDIFLKEPDLINILFGKELFNSSGNYGGGVFGIRQIHVDYNLLLHGSGLIGLFLYYTFQFSLLVIFFKLKKKSTLSKKEKNNLGSIFLSYFFIAFIISLSGGINGVLYNSIRYLYLGGIIKILNNTKQEAESYDKIILINGL